MAKRKRSALKAGRPRAQAAGRAEIKGIMTRVNPEGWRALRMLALDLGVPLQSLCVEAFNDLLRKHRRPAVVENPLLND
jgi:hypothetical protein